jgi:nucleoside-diphosphate-sugar epimerase
MEEGEVRVLALVTGAGGFIGGHLTAALLAEGHQVRAVDIKPLEKWYQVQREADNRPVYDLNYPYTCKRVAENAEEVYHLAADMGGMGYIEHYKAACMLNVLNSANMLVAARDELDFRRYFYASTACVYRADRQETADPEPLREDRDVYPAMPEDGYGWEKLFSERMARHFAEDYFMVTRVARYHSTYGPFGTWDGGREKVPAALCRKVAAAKLTGASAIEVWGDGQQGRSFLYIDDCVRGTLAVMRSSCAEPLNIGSDRLVTVDQLAELVMDIAGYRVRIEHVPGPLGVRGRSSDNTKVTTETGWKPEVSLEDGMERTYRWISDQVGS